MANSNYIELLKDPRWQKKRLEIFKLDGWQCRQCNAKDKTLHVHHLYYLKDKFPWEYDNSVLVTLCEHCHSLTKNIDWKRAFLDLNLCEFDLLEIALQLRFRKEKFDILVADVQKKHGVRTMFHYMYMDFFKDQEEVDEYYSDVNEERKHYSNGKEIH